jgi:penicillin-binding protein 1A
MKAVLDEIAPPAPAGQKLVRRFVFALLVFLAALVGALTGLLLVYSTDLPQVEQLESYRPSSSTDLYDVHGRVIGSFALQRRVVASYNDFPRPLIDALISIEDKDFYRHWGINVWRIAGAAYRDIESGGRVQGAIDAHYAVGAQSFSLARPVISSQDRRSAIGHPNRAPLH